jgi:restriction system protein
MAVWMVRGGRHAEFEGIALENQLAVVGWSEIPDLSGFATREALSEAALAAYPERKTGAVRNTVGQLWALREGIQIGDLIAMPLKSRDAVVLGNVTGSYRHRTDLMDQPVHTRPVKWESVELSRSTLPPDILASLSSDLTVCGLRAENAEARLRALLGGQPDVKPPIDPETPINVEEYAENQIRTYIGLRFKGHELARLVESVLLAQGYQTFTSPPGADGGVDIVAGKGPLGFDPPRLCVQVKATASRVDVKVLRELLGVLPHRRANQGLLVSWGGYTEAAVKEANQSYFSVRLWDSERLLQALLDNYEKLPPEIQAELPLKRIWTLVPEEE